jgi:hypothetical protein
MLPMSFGFIWRTKPFGFPLTDEENRLLKITGGIQIENRKARAQSQSSPTPTPDNPYSRAN